MLKELYAGRSVHRALLHEKVRVDVQATGTLLDLGGGRRQSYLEYMDLTQVERFIVLDLAFGEISALRPEWDQVKGSVTDMPIEANTINTVLCFSLLEHVYDYQRALNEIQRVMRSGAFLYGWVPFAFPVHGAPYDYWRYTELSLRNIISSSGLVPTKIESRGNTFLVIADLLLPYCRFSFLTPFARVGLTALAQIAAAVAASIARRRDSPLPYNCPSGIWFSCTKP